MKNWLIVKVENNLEFVVEWMLLYILLIIWIKKKNSRILCVILLVWREILYGIDVFYRKMLNLKW